MFVAATKSNVSVFVSGEYVPRMVGWLLDRVPDLATLRFEPYQGTLLHLAAEWGRYQIASLALARGADPGVRDGRAESSEAREQFQHELVRLREAFAGALADERRQHLVELGMWHDQLATCQERWRDEVVRTNLNKRGEG